MRRDFFRAVEGALFSLPTLTKQLALREEFIIARCRSSDGFIKPDGSASKSASMQENVLFIKEKDPEYQLLLARIETIRQAFECLPKNLQHLITLYYFERRSRYEVMDELAISEREFYRQRRKAVEKCAPFILGPFGM